VESAEVFHDILAESFLSGCGLYFSEIPTQVFPFFEDIDILGLDVRDHLFTERLEFFICRARSLQYFFPVSLDVIHFHVFCSSGVSTQSGNFKTSLHLVWPDLQVNCDIAKNMRQATIKHFENLEISSPYIHDLALQMKASSSLNTWRNIFDEASVRKLNGLRMPFADKISRKTGVPENRPMLPLGTCSYSKSDESIKWVTRVNGSLGREEISRWMKLGSLRLPNNAEVTAETFCRPHKV
jgi:hypothetical protein